MEIKGEIVHVHQLGASQKDQMFQLMHSYFKGMDRRRFDCDLLEKQWVILLTDEKSSTLCGFSTQKVFDHSLGSRRKIRVLYSGDTIIHREYWHNNPLAGLWGRMALRLIQQSPHIPVYWLLLSQGFRTYRYLPLFFHEFYPNYREATPEDVRQILDAIATTVCPYHYHPESGVVQAVHYRLREGVSDVRPSLLKNAHIQHYLSCNPGHADGDELCCLVPLRLDNYKRAAYRVIEAATINCEGEEWFALSQTRN